MIIYVSKSIGCTTVRVNPTVNYRFWWLLFFHVGSPNITLGAGHWLQRRLHVVGADGMWERSVCWALLLSCVWLFVTPQTVAHQAPLSMGFSQQAAVSSSRGSSRPKDRICISSTAGRFSVSEPQGKPSVYKYFIIIAQTHWKRHSAGCQEQVRSDELILTSVSGEN